MNEKSEAKISKYLSYILRHKPDSIELKIDNNGWANIDELVDKTQEFNITREIIEQIVKNSDKQRFIIKNNKIRANQGHSIDIDLQLLPDEPPAILYHGTASKNIDSILSQGLLPKQRQYVHLSSNIETATSVGSRYGKPAIITISAKKMHKDGFDFYQADNGVWLTKEVPSKYLQ